jgi:hypothetical protein
MVNRKIKYLENLLIWFHHFAQKYKLNYWLDFGTLLGVYRDKCIIPWDKDVDVGIDIRQAEFLVKCLLKDGIPFSWARQPPYHSLIHIGDLDVFFWKLEGDTYYSLHPWCQKSYFPYHFVEKMETLEFKSIHFNVPNKLPEFLKMRYGADFMTPRKDVTGQNRENNANAKVVNNLQEEFNKLNVITRNKPQRLNRNSSRIIIQSNNKNINFDHYNHRMNQQINNIDERNNFLNNNDLNEDEKNEIRNEIKSDEEKEDMERKKTAIKNFYNEMTYYVNRTRKIENQLRSNYLKKSLLYKYK